MPACGQAPPFSCHSETLVSLHACEKKKKKKKLHWRLCCYAAVSHCRGMCFLYCEGAVKRAATGSADVTTEHSDMTGDEDNRRRASLRADAAPRG